MHNLQLQFMPGDTVRIKNKFASTYKVREVVINQKHEVWYRGWVDNAPLDEYGNILSGFVWEWQAENLELEE